MSKARKLGLQLLHAHRSFLRRLRLRSPTLLLDEMETFEASRRTRPLTLPVLIERQSRFVLGADADLLPPRGRLSARFRQRRDRDEAREGRRRNRSSRVVQRLLRVASRSVAGRARLLCDRKRTYPVLAQRAFGEKGVVVVTHSSKRRRNTKNPLFPINHTNAMFRDLSSRLRRRSWLVSKKRHALRISLAVVVCFRNYVRPRFNRDAGKPIRTPAQRVGLCPRAMTFEQLLSWRQDWGRCSTSLLEGN